MSQLPLSRTTLDRLGDLPSADIAAVTDLCDPLRPLAYDVQDMLRVDLGSVRGGDVFAPIARQIERSIASRRVHLVSGLPGCGKSTEILRLKARLEGKQKASSSRRFKTVYIDMLEYLSIKDLDFSWIMLGVLSVLVQKFEGLAKTSKQLQQLWNDLRTVLNAAEVKVASEINVEGHWYDVDPVLHRLPRFAEAVEAFEADDPATRNVADGGE